MGGWGSGRREYASTPTVEECRHLDIDRVKDLTEHIDKHGAVWWGERGDPEAWITVKTVGERRLSGESRPAAVRLQYTITHKRTEEKTQVEYPIPLMYTECNFGGHRPWFKCPGVVDGERCGRRARKLYLPHRRWAKYYLCRECYDLGYTSSRRSGDDLKQAELRFRRAYAKADAEQRRPHPNNTDVPWHPERPKGMHHETYQEHLEDVEDARQEWEKICMMELRAMTGRLEEVHT